MSRHNVRVSKKSPYRSKKNIDNNIVDVHQKKTHGFTKVVMEKQALRQRYIELMNDAEKAVGRKEAIYLLRDAEIIWQKINI